MQTQGANLADSSVQVHRAATKKPESFFAGAAIGGCVSAFVSASLNGLDVTKVRMQNQSATNKKYTGFIPGMRLIYKEEGLAGLTKGIYPSMLREITYSSIRIGGYEPIRRFLAVTFTDNHDGSAVNTSPLIKYFAALITGGCGSAMCNPFDLAKTAFQAVLPSTPGVENKTALKFDTTWAFLRYTYQQNGVKGLYKGWAATSARAAMLTSAQLGSYDTIKNNILKKRFGFQEGFSMHLAVSMTVGIITTTAANPCKIVECCAFYAHILLLFTFLQFLHWLSVDVIKTRYLADVRKQYKSIPDCIVKLFKAEGVKGFFKVSLLLYSLAYNYQG